MLVTVTLHGAIAVTSQLEDKLTEDALVAMYKTRKFQSSYNCHQPYRPNTRTDLYFHSQTRFVDSHGLLANGMCFILKCRRVLIF